MIRMKKREVTNIHYQEVIRRQRAQKREASLILHNNATVPSNSMPGCYVAQYGGIPHIGDMEV